MFVVLHQIEMLKSTIQDMEKERDFYFGKLRNIELICQEKEGEGDPTLQRIIDILYATDVSPLLFSLTSNSLFRGFKDRENLKRSHKIFHLYFLFYISVKRCLD